MSACRGRSGPSRCRRSAYTSPSARRSAANLFSDACLICDLDVHARIDAFGIDADEDRHEAAPLARLSRRAISIDSGSDSTMTARKSSRRARGSSTLPAVFADAREDDALSPAPPPPERVSVRPPLTTSMRRAEGNGQRRQHLAWSGIGLHRLGKQRCSGLFARRPRPPRNSSSIAPLEQRQKGGFRERSAIVAKSDVLGNEEAPVAIGEGAHSSGLLQHEDRGRERLALFWRHDRRDRRLGQAFILWSSNWLRAVSAAHWGRAEAPARP